MKREEGALLRDCSASEVRGGRATSMQTASEEKNAEQRYRILGTTYSPYGENTYIRISRTSLTPVLRPLDRQAGFEVAGGKTCYVGFVYQLPG